MQCVEQIRNICLTDHQQIVYSSAIDFLKNSEPILVIVGQAGTGKTTITRKIVEYARSMKRLKVVGVAPTHKARRVLEQVLNRDTFLRIQTMTVAGLLNKMRGHSYIGTSRYVRDGSHKLDSFDLFIIDEVSMICDSDYKEIVKLGEEYRKKIIFIGDYIQIPNPSQKFSRLHDSLVKPDSIAFKNHNCLELTQVIRQGEANPLREVYKKFRGQDLMLPVVFDRTSKHNSRGEGVEYVSDHEEFITFLKTRFNRESKIIVYTNKNVSKYNQLIRQKLEYDVDYQPGEPLMGYQNIYGVIENGQEYTVVTNLPVSNHCIMMEGGLIYTDLVGCILGLRDEMGVERSVFLPNPVNPANLQILNELVRRAERVNSIGSSKRDFREYMNLKSKLLFTDNIYKYDGQILTHHEFVSSHPLLFTGVSDTVEEKDGRRKVLSTPQVQQLRISYTDLLQHRLKDSKTIADNEQFADRFMILEKDLDYSYAITAHKSQGSTYKHVFIDETDFMRIKDRWNFRYKLRENRVKERNQLLYVAYSRSSHNVCVFYQD